MAVVVVVDATEARDVPFPGDHLRGRAWFDSGMTVYQDILSPNMKSLQPISTLRQDNRRWKQLP